MNAVKKTNAVKARKKTIVTTVNEPKMTLDDVVRSQKPFLQAVEDKMKKEGLNYSQVAEKVGVPYSYIIALNSGSRSIGKAERSTVEKFATYLNVPVVQIYLWSDFLAPNDFILKVDMDRTLENAYKTMLDDPMLMSTLPKKAIWEKWPLESKIAITRMYEMLARKLVFEYAEAELPPAKFKKVKNVIKR